MLAITLPAVAGWAVLGVAILLVVVWTIRLRWGAPFRPAVLGALTAAYFLLFVLVETGGLFDFAALAALDLVLLGVPLVLMYLHTTRTVVPEETPRGIRYRGSPVIALVWLVLLVLELAAEQSVLGSVTIFNVVSVNGFSAPSPPIVAALPEPYRSLLLSLNALFAIGTGVILGYNVGVFSAVLRFRWRRRLESGRAASSS